MFFCRSFFFSVLLVSSLAAKVIHLSSHRSSLPILLFVLYLPTFFIPDALLIVGARLLLSSRSNANFIFTTAAILTSIICVITLFTSASQLAFYLETGGEISWSAAGNFAHDPAGLKLLASGSLGVGLCTAGLTFIATILNPYLYNQVGNALEFVGQVFRRQSVSPKAQLSEQPYHDEPSLDPPIGEKTVQPVVRRKLLWRVILVSLLGLVVLLQVVRPRSSPYAHLSTTLPFTLYLMFGSAEAAICGANAASMPFPKPELLKSLGWPSNSSEVFDYMIAKYPSIPGWLPKDPIPGFGRLYWQPDNDTSPDSWMPYTSTYDPVKVSNSEEGILEPLRAALEKNDVLIKHVVVFHLESTRQDSFPLTNGSNLLRIIELEKGKFDGLEELDSRLSTISENAELLTGVDGHLTNKPSAASAGWRRHLQAGKGGINVVGSITAGTATLKSLIGSICGAEPLPVDFTEEADLEIYQPCLPHVFNLLSQGKEPTHGDGSRAEVMKRPWRSVHAQAITDQFDRQDVLMDNMGFNLSIARNMLMDPTSAHFPPVEPEANYFGYPETELKPYIRDLFEQSEKDGTRLFLSHLTSTTHHPWSVPQSFGEDENFLNTWHWHEERPLNRYLNTLRYQDRWIGQFMDVVEEAGVLDETLIVFAGDHGMAFREDCEALTTYENAHVINFHVPLLFFHPKLPRIQLQASSTSLSILPTILDLLVQSNSLDKLDSGAAAGLMREYEGQSLIRPYLTERDGRQDWHFTVINAGAALLSISSATVPYRLVIPLCKTAPYRFSDLEDDPSERNAIETWTMAEMAQQVSRRGGRAGQAAAAWVQDAERMGLWWAAEQKKKWQYSGASLQDDKPGGSGVGQLQHDHWWNTR